MTPEALIYNLQDVLSDPWGDGQDLSITDVPELLADFLAYDGNACYSEDVKFIDCLLYTSPSPRDRQKSRMPSSA